MSPDRGALRRQGRLSPSWIGIRAVAAVTPGLVVEACDWLVVTSARLTIRRHIWIVGVAVAVAVLGGVLLFLATRDEGLPRYLEGRWHDGDGAVVPDGTDRGKDFALGSGGFKARSIATGSPGRPCRSLGLRDPSR